MLQLGCGGHRDSIVLKADTQVLPADGVSFARLTIVGLAAKPILKVREGPRHLHIDSLARTGDVWQANVRAGVLPGRATVEAENAALLFEVKPAYADRERDGTPDFLRLDAVQDRQAFRRWFTFLAESQYFRSPLPRDIVDCAALIRYAFRESLRPHDDAWSDSLHLRLVPAIPGVGKYQYPYTPLGANLFRVRGGPFVPQDLGDGAFAQFADAQSLLRFNAHFVTKDLRRALPGDMLFFRQREQKMPFHTMIYIGASQVDGSAGPYLLYHTGPNGEIRRVTVDELERHPEPRWRPFSSNENFLGVYRWNIL